MTFYIQTLLEGQQPSRHETAWRPWINCTDRAEIVAMAAHRCVRESGIMRQASAPRTVRVLSAESLPPATGPCTVEQTVFVITPESLTS